MAFLWFIKTAGFFNTAGKRCGNAILVKSTNGVQNKMHLIKENPQSWPKYMRETLALV